MYPAVKSLCRGRTATRRRVRDGELHEIKSADILQPGPAALSDGVRRIHEILTAWAAGR